MHPRPIAVAALLLAALTACSSSGGDPKLTPTVTVTSSPSLSKEEAAKQCVDALTERAMESQGEVPFDPTPAPCAPLDDSEYLDAYYEGLEKANEAGLGG